VSVGYKSSASRGSDVLDETKNKPREREIHRHLLSRSKFIKQWDKKHRNFNVEASTDEKTFGMQ